MFRIVLSLSLVFATAVVQAADPVPATTEAGSCAKTTGPAEKPAEATVAEPASTPGATSPVRPRSSGAQHARSQPFHRFLHRGLRWVSKGKCVENCSRRPLLRLNIRKYAYFDVAS